ncbi:MAG: hypothetical protein ACREE6_02595, partial [Limisphaerales bacterium]
SGFAGRLLAAWVRVPVPLLEQIRRVEKSAACGNVALTDFERHQKPTMMVVMLAHASNGVAHHFRGVAIIAVFDLGFDLAGIHRREVYVILTLIGSNYPHIHSIIMASCSPPAL